jgi:hypothetical protein
MEIKTWLPLFKGFYGTFWDGDDELNDYCWNYNVSSDDVQVDWSAYHKMVAFTFVEKMQDDLIPMGFIESMTFEKISSPKYYNFENDSIYVTIVPKVEAIKTYIHQYMSEFDAYVKEKYTSRDGFTSFHPNTAFEWGLKTDNFNVLDNDGHTLGCLLDFIMTNDGHDDNEYLNAVNECINFDEYCEIIQRELNDIELFKDRVKVIRDNIDDIDLEHGYLKILSIGARAKSNLLGTDFIEELVEVAYSELIDALPFNHIDNQLRPIYN